MADPKPPSRDQLAKFLPDAESIKLFERLFAIAGNLTPTDIAALTRLVQEVSLESASAVSSATEALDSLNRIADSLELLSSAPVQNVDQQPDVFEPPSTMPAVNELADVSSTLPAAGNLLIYNATLRRWVNALLTQGANITVTNADGAVTIAVSGLGTASTLTSDTDGTLAANSDTRVATQKATKTYVDTAVTGLLDFKGSTNCSGNPNYPAALKGDAYVVSVAGKIGGASGTSVDIGDMYVASADNAGGTQASVGTSWFVLEHNLAGVLLSANNLSDLANAATARTNLGLGTAALTDYSTGTWTPVATATDPGITPPSIASASGTYTKIGSTVYCTYNILFGANGTGAGQIKLTGNPFTPSQRGFGTGMETDVLGFNTMSQTIAATDATYIGKTDATYPGGTSYRLMGNFTYIV